MRVVHQGQEARLHVSPAPTLLRQGVLALENCLAGPRPRHGPETQASENRLAVAGCGHCRIFYQSQKWRGRGRSRGLALTVGKGKLRPSPGEKGCVHKPLQVSVPHSR